MPCRCDYMDPNEREKQSQKVCSLLVDLYFDLYPNQKVLPRLLAAAQNEYGNVVYVDEDTAELCGIIEGFTGEQKKVYLDWNNKKWRPLAKWWEEHQENDIQRKKEKDEAIKRIQAIETALAKLTPTERKLLNL